MRVTLGVLIPAYNEEDVLGKTISSMLLAGMSPTDIFVINDASTDRTAIVANQFGVNVMNNQVNLGKAEGLARALKECSLLTRYSHVCFIDADTLVDRGYFKSIRERLIADSVKCERRNRRKGREVATPIGVVCGRPKSIPYNWLTAYRAYQYFLTDFIHRPGQVAFRSITVAPGCAATYSVDVLAKLHFSGDTLVEDMDLTVQANLLGARIVYEPKAVVYTQDPRHLKSYVGQVGKRWYAGTWQIMRKYGLLWTGWFSPLHWECRIAILFDSIPFLASLFYAHKNWKVFFMGLAVTFGITTLLAATASIKEKRRDIVLFSPLYSVLWILDFALFIWASSNIITGPKERKKWYSVPRYATTSEPMTGDGEK